jgi:AbrB family looped-hinge helix DNA binding protein
MKLRKVLHYWDNGKIYSEHFVDCYNRCQGEYKQYYEEGLLSDHYFLKGNNIHGERFQYGKTGDLLNHFYYWEGKFMNKGEFDKLDNKEKSTELKTILKTVVVGENGEITLPEEIVEKFGLHSGDLVEIDLLDNKSISLNFPKKENIEIELSDEVLLMLTVDAHKKDITLNELIVSILKEQLSKEESL